MYKNLRRRQSELKQEASKKGLQSDALKSWVIEQTAAKQAEIHGQQKEVLGKREKWLGELGRIVPAQELRLGKTLAFKPSEYRDMALAALNSSSDRRERRVLDFLAAFASESVTNGELLEPTPFCFVTGSGHQYFLKTIGKLMRVVDACRIERCLFHPWTFDDERLSLRWASVEDRRYALMWDDPGAQEARTIWAASLLA